MAKDGINNLICDNILRKFDGQKAISRAKMREISFYANIDADWGVIERHIEFMLEDRTLKEDESMLSLTNKGWFMLNHTEKLGYVAQKIEEAQWRRSESDVRMVIRATIYVALGAAALWAITRLISILL
jgi:hypothetical protein